MRLHQDGNPGNNVIRAYAPGMIRINEVSFTGSVIVSATQILTEPLLATLGDLSHAFAQRVLDLEPDLVLLGTGIRQAFPAAAFAAEFLSAAVGFEVMDTGAACRTFNVLVAEHRRVVAVLLAQ
jgi:uncharacterized protein